MTIYIDKDFKCYATNDGTMRGFDVPFFDGKCREFIEGYRYIPAGETWDKDGGSSFRGEAVFPRENSRKLSQLQMEYEAALLNKLRSEFEKAVAALKKLHIDPAEIFENIYERTEDI